MQTIIASLVALLLLVVPVTGYAQDARATLERAAAAMGASGLTTLEYTATGTMFDVGQSAVPGQRGPQFTLRSYTRSISYETTSVRTDLERARAEARGGGAPAPRQIWMVSGDHAWNVVGDTAAPAPVALAQRQFELWTTPHGIIKAAMKYNATVEGRTISFAVPDRFRARATLTEANLVDKVEAVIPNPVVGDLPVEIRYADYKDFGGVTFPTKISQSAAGSPWFELAVNEVRPNAAVDITVPESVQQAVRPYARVTNQKVADGVWYLTGGSHHSVAIEMKDHVIVVEAPLNDDRAMGVIMAVRELVPTKPIAYVVASHHHFDHAGGLRVRFGRRHRRRARERSRVPDAGAGRASDDQSRSPGQVGQESQGGRRARPARDERRHANGGDPSRGREQSRGRDADGVSPEGKAPDPGGHVHPGAAERTRARGRESEHRQPGGQHHPARLGR